MAVLMMAELETSKRAGRGSDKSNKHHKYTLDEVITQIYLVKSTFTRDPK